MSFFTYNWVFFPSVNESVPVYIAAPSNSYNSFYYNSPLCQPDSLWDVHSAEILDTVRGLRLIPTTYDILALRNDECKLLCVSPSFEGQGEYSRNFMHLISSNETPLQLYVGGVLVDYGVLGVHTADDFYIMNHVRFLVESLSKACTFLSNVCPCHSLSSTFNMTLCTQLVVLSCNTPSWTSDWLRDP